MLVELETKLLNKDFSKYDNKNGTITYEKRLSDLFNCQNKNFLSIDVTKKDLFYKIEFGIVQSVNMYSEISALSVVKMDLNVGVDFDNLDLILSKGKQMLEATLILNKKD